MSMADPSTYLAPITAELVTAWPANRIINIVCHGHSVPAGYFRTPVVDTLGAYPHQVLVGLKERYPNAVINVIVTAIGGEDSESGQRRFEQQVLCHRPDLVIIDYATNDRHIGLERAGKAWTAMIRSAKSHGAKVMLMTSAHELHSHGHIPPQDAELRRQDHCQLVRTLATAEAVALADTDRSYALYLEHGGAILDLLSQVNHPNRQGHALIARDILRWFFCA
jgi:acyl-CoA thioesterase-1